MNKHRMITAAVLMWGVASVTNAWSDDSTNTTAEASSKSSAFKPKEGFYIGLQFVDNFMDGAFDDSIYLRGGSSLYDVPAVDNGLGFGVVFGGRFEGGALEIAYQRTTHDTTSSFASMAESEATYSVCEFNLKFDLTRTRLRPFIQVGFGIPWMTIDNGATDGRSYYDETFFGVDVNVGAGLTYFLTERWALNAGVVYRWNWFLTVDGMSIEDTLLENTINCTVGVS